MTRKVERMVWAGVFLALLVSAVIGNVIGARPFDFGNSASVDAPGLPGRDAFDTGYYVGVDDYLAETLATRELGVRTRGFVDYEVFGDSTSPLVVIGSDGAAFYAGYLFPDCDQLEGVVPLGDRVDDPTDSRIRYLIVSPKSDLQADSLPDFARPPDCVAEARRVREAAIERDPLGIEPAPDLADRPPATAFFPTGTQWSPAARIAVARRIVEAYEPRCGIRTLLFRARWSGSRA